MAREDHRASPHDLDAERALLGAVLLSSTALEAVRERVTPGDFFRPAHQSIFQAVMRLHGRGEATDPVTVSAELKAHDLLEESDGLMGLIELQGDAPSTANAPHYARIVVGHSIRRNIIGVANEALRVAYACQEDAEDIGDALITRIQEAYTGMVVEEPTNLWRLDDFLDRPMEQRPPWVVPGMIRVGWRVMVVASEGSGKLLPLDTSLATPDGWTTMGEVGVGDRLFDRHGFPCSVVAVSRVDPEPSSYEITFSDGSTQVACADHQWVTVDYARRQSRHPQAWEHQAITTHQIRETLRTRGDHCLNHAIVVAGALELPDVELPVDPYLLGVWLGDGATNDGALHLSDRDGKFILNRISWPHHVVPSSIEGDVGSSKYRLDGFRVHLREHGLLGKKHVPEPYLRASREQRLALLQGLMDTDGYIGKGGRGKGRGAGATNCELTFTDERLAQEATALIRTLGIIPAIRESEARIGGRYISQRWRITFQTDQPVVTVPFKADRIGPLRTRRSQLRYIKEVNPVDPVPMRCITVDSPDGTYLCGENLIPTHNTAMARQIAIATAQGIHPFHFQPMDPIQTLLVDLENPDDSIQEVCNPIRLQAQSIQRDSYDADRAWLWWRQEGIDLRSRRDRSEFEAVLKATRPQLVCLGPLYKAMRMKSGENEEVAVREVQSTLDDLRVRYGFALMIEHHAPHGQTGKREMRPSGTSLWKRWPEIGIGMVPASGDGLLMRLDRFRGDRLETAWPTEIRRTRASARRWPWEGVWPTGTFAATNEHPIPASQIKPQPQVEDEPFPDKVTYVDDDPPF